MVSESVVERSRHFTRGTFSIFPFSVAKNLNGKDRHSCCGPLQSDLEILIDHVTSVLLVKDARRSVLDMNVIML